MNFLGNFSKTFQRLWQKLCRKFEGGISTPSGEAENTTVNDPVPDSDHILRYVKPTSIHEGVIIGDAFLGRSSEEDPSVNWIEYFPGDLDNKLSEIRKRRRVKYAATGLLARLNVGTMRSHVLEKTLNEHNLGVIQEPLEVTDNFEEDPSHALIKNLPTDDLERVFVGDLIAQRILDSFLAIPKED